MTSQFEDSGYLARRPISTHKAFVPIVALWFAALLGLGSLVLPVARIENLLLLSGIANYLQVIAPPLDLTGRIIVAIVLALLGGAMGQAIARRLALAHTGSVAQDADTETRAPISAHEELGDAEAEAPRRSRRLAIAEDAEEEQVIEFAPLPTAVGPDIDTEDNAVVEAEIFAPEEIQQAIGELAPNVVDEVDLELVEEAEAEEASAANEIDFSVPAPEMPEQEIPAEPETVEPEIESAPPEEPPVAESVEEAVQEVTIAPVGSPCQKQPLEELGLVQLVERLGASLERQRGMRAGIAADTPAPQPAPETAPARPGFHGREMAKAVETQDAESLEIEAPAPAPDAEPAQELLAAEEKIATEPWTLDAPAAEAEAEPAAAAIAAEHTVEAEPEVVAGENAVTEAEVECETESPIDEEVAEVESDDVVEATEPEPEPETAIPFEEKMVEADLEDIVEDTQAEPELQPEVMIPAKEDVVEVKPEDVAEKNIQAKPEVLAPLVSPFDRFASFDGDHEDEDEELASLADSFRLPIGDVQSRDTTGQGISVPEDDEDEVYDEEDGGDKVYGSLLSLRQPLQDAVVTPSNSEPEPEPETEAGQAENDDPPTVDPVDEEDQAATLPSAPARELDTEAHQRALRDALLSLQRLDRTG